MELKGKKVLVTGAGGFIGSHLVERLVAEGCDVRAMVHYNSSGRWGNLELLPQNQKEQLEIIAADITDPFSVQKAVEGCEVVFHLAALIAIPYSYAAPQSYVNVNVAGTLNVLEACRQAGVMKVVHTSTSETYGTAMYTPIDEKHPLQGQSPYSASKIGADKFAESYYCSFNLPVATIRPFNTYGPRQSARAVIPAIISQILSGKSTIKLGSLDPVRDFNFVKDTAEGFIAVATSSRSIGETINVGFGKGITIGDLAQTIVRLIGREVVIECDNERVRPENSEVMELLCDNRKALELTGWQPRYDLESGLRETIDYIEQNLSLYKTDIYNV
jgi:NAD dependent epimerase/dehydratase